MFSVSKLSNDSKAFILKASVISKNSQEVMAMAAAKAISNELALPSSQVENPTEFYLNTVYSHAREIICCLNELIVIDVNRVQELIKTFWLVRYNIVFPRKKLFVTNAIVSESHFFGFSSQLSPADAIIIQVNTPALVALNNGFCQMICEMSVSEEQMV